MSLKTPTGKSSSSFYCLNRKSTTSNFLRHIVSLVCQAHAVIRKVGGVWVFQGLGKKGGYMGGHIEKQILYSAPFQYHNLLTLGKIIPTSAFGLECALKLLYVCWRSFVYVFHP